MTSEFYLWFIIPYTASSSICEICVIASSTSVVTVGVIPYLQQTHARISTRLEIMILRGLNILMQQSSNVLKKGTGMSLSNQIRPYVPFL